MKKTFRQPFASLLISNQDGAAAIVSIVVLTALIVLISASTGLMGIANLENGFSMQQGTGMTNVADACVDEAILRLMRDSSYSGGSTTVGATSCTIAVTGTPCGTCDITAEATQNNYTRRIQASVQISGGSSDIISWEEID